MLEVARLKAWPVFVLYLDVTKAYDRIDWELVLGWPSGMSTSGYDYLRSSGIGEVAAACIAFC